MKRIIKGSQPREFTQWKLSDPMKHRPNWNRVPKYVKQTIHQSLLQEQGFLCCYCENSVNHEESHIEHFRPRISNREFQLDYDNLLVSCQRELSKGVPRHCGHSKGSWFDGDLLISPLAVDCENRFFFTANGDVFARRPDDEGAETTIRKLCLNIRKLRSLRAAAVSQLYNELPEDIELLLVKGSDGKFLAFHTTIRQVLT